MNLKKLRGLAHVIRWNFHPRVRQETVAEHSFWTAIYTMRLTELAGFGEGEQLRLLKCALLHDAEEAITGDIPGLVKRGRSWEDVEADARRELDMERVPHDVVVKAADLISALVFADEEVKMGNTHFKRIRGELVQALIDSDTLGVGTLLYQLGFRMDDALPPHQEMSHL